MAARLVARVAPSTHTLPAWAAAWTSRGGVHGIARDHALPGGSQVDGNLAGDDAGAQLQ